MYERLLLGVSVGVVVFAITAVRNSPLEIVPSIATVGFGLTIAAIGLSLNSWSLEAFLEAPYFSAVASAAMVFGVLSTLRSLFR